MARFTEGWIRLERRVVNEDIGERGTILAVWITLLCWACRFETKINFGGKQKALPPGSCVFGVREMADHLGFSKDTVYRSLQYLKNRDTICIETATSGTIVTICNWATYQHFDEKAATQPRHKLRHGPDTDRTRTGHGPTLNGEENKETNKQRTKRSVGILADYPPEFDEIWKTYGRRGDKKEAFEAFKALGVVNGNFENLKTAIDNYARANPDVKWRWHFSKFLRSDWRENLKTPESNQDNVFDFLPKNGTRHES